LKNGLSLIPARFIFNINLKKVIKNNKYE